jgi:hypothetical protein
MFPVDAGIDPRTLRRHTPKAGAALADRAAIRPPAGVPAITVTVDSTSIRSREDGERRFEVRVGNVETKAGGCQVFGSVAKAGTDIEALIRKNLDAVGGTGDTALTAFTDGCPGLRGILADAGVLEPLILDWFHIAMRLQHLKQIGDGLAAVDPARAAAKAVIVTEVERLHWRIWNGKAKNAGKSLDRIHGVMHRFRGERDSRKSIAPSRKLWTAVRALNRYLIGQSAWPVNYAERHRAGLRVGTAITCGSREGDKRPPRTLRCRVEEMAPKKRVDRFAGFEASCVVTLCCALILLATQPKPTTSTAAATTIATTSPFTTTACERCLPQPLRFAPKHAASLTCDVGLVF